MLARATLPALRQLASPHAWRLLGLFGVVVGAIGCWRADVHVITDPPASDAAVRADVLAITDPLPSDAAVRADVLAITDPLPSDAAVRADVHAITDPLPSDAAVRADDVSADSPSAVICPSPALRPDDTRRTVRVGSLDRSYLLHVPRTYDGSKPVPLIVDFHKGGDSGSTEMSDSPYPAVTDPEGVIMAFPDGRKGPGPNGALTGWNLGPCCVENVDDVAFAKALVAQVQTTACIDPDRIYAVGAGGGGGMAYRIACDAGEVFAAVAATAWDLLVENVDDCRPKRPITVISFRGTADTVVPYDGGVSSVVQDMTITFIGAKPTFEKWAELDGCTGSPTGPDSNGCSSYSSCKDGVEVFLCTNPEGHPDPGDASVAWPLLKRHPL